MKKLSQLILATLILSITSTGFTKQISKSEFDYAELDLEDVMDELLPAPNVFSQPDFDFLDCHGKPFNTKVLSEQEPTDLEVSCSVQGIINTKFQYNPNSSVLKSAIELTESEKEYVMGNLGMVEPKAVFAYFVYVTTTSIPEYNFYLETESE